ncbi:hypothetical protein OROGR_016038 [Orobanche gracilis]
MGREWLHWIAAGGRPSTRRRRLSAETEKTSSAGCMCAVFQLFDLQHHPFNYQPDSGSHFLQEEAKTSKGVEAPRNSLELEGPAAMKEEDNSNFPVIKVGINHIKTRVASKSRTEDNNSISSDCSPGTAKTPNLVARLMGLDLLPECNNSPSFSCPNSKPGSKKISHIFNQNRSKTCFSDDDIAVGARSSSARRSDFEYHSHRLSLQINKENNGEFAISGKMRGRSGKFRQDENTRLSAGHFVKQVVNQVTEKAGRKVGLTDITNNTNYREEKEKTLRRDQNLFTRQQPAKKNNPNISPKIKSLDTKKKIVASSGTKSPRNSTSSSLDSNDHDHHQSRGILKDGKRVGGGNANIFSGTKKLQSAPQTCDYYSVKNKKAEPPVGSSAKDNAKNSTDKKKTKKLAQLMSSSEIQNITGPTILSVKKSPSPPATKLPQKQVSSDALSSKRETQLSRKSSRSYKHLSLQPDRISTVLPDRNNGCATTTASAASEYKDYVQKILKRAGIDGKGKWHTVSHPLDPSIFYYLELFSGSVGGGSILNLRCNRELIFQLVDELLAEILKPYLDFKPWVDTNLPVNGIDQLGLCDELCKKIGDFPAADCRVFEDIDSLIEKDLCTLSLDGYFLDEGERLVCEIEGEIIDMLLCETVAVVGGVSRATEKERKTERRHGSRARDGNHVMRWNHPRGEETALLDSV